MGGDRDEAGEGQSVATCRADEIDCSRGDGLVAADGPPQVADQFEATLVWMAEDALQPGRAYWLKLGTQNVSATVQPPKYTIDVNTMRSEEHTSELQSLMRISYAVFCMKKKHTTNYSKLTHINHKKTRNQLTKYYIKN